MRLICGIFRENIGMIFNEKLHEAIYAFNVDKCVVTVVRLAQKIGSEAIGQVLGVHSVLQRILGDLIQKAYQIVEQLVIACRQFGDKQVFGHFNFVNYV